MTSFANEEAFVRLLFERKEIFFFETQKDFLDIGSLFLALFFFSSQIESDFCNYIMNDRFLKYYF